jgi:hypothetical protein
MEATVSVYLHNLMVARGPAVIAIVKVNIPAVVGTPEMIPRLAVKVNPVGSCP